MMYALARYIHVAITSELASKVEAHDDDIGYITTMVVWALVR